MYYIIRKNIKINKELIQIIIMAATPKIHLELIGEDIENYLEKIENTTEYFSFEDNINHGSVTMYNNNYSFSKYTGSSDSINNIGRGLVIKNVSMSDSRMDKKEVTRTIEDFEEIKDLVLNQTDFPEEKVYIYVTAKG